MRVDLIKTTHVRLLNLTFRGKEVSGNLCSTILYSEFVYCGKGYTITNIFYNLSVLIEIKLVQKGNNISRRKNKSPDVKTYLGRKTGF